MLPLCRIDLLGRLCVHRADREITRFRTYKTGALLAHLAYYRPHPHPRDRLIALLWPDAHPQDGRQSLSQSLSSLRHQLEPPGTPAGSLLPADRFTVRLHPDRVATDVEQFESLLDAAARLSPSPERTDALRSAVEGYGGDLLPGYYEDWVIQEQRRLSERYHAALGELIRACRAAGRFDDALHFARSAVGADPLREEAHESLLLVLSETGQWSSAVRHCGECERILWEGLGGQPGAPLRNLIGDIRTRSRALQGSPTPVTSPSVQSRLKIRGARHLPPSEKPDSAPPSLPVDPTPTGYSDLNPAPSFPMTPEGPPRPEITDTGPECKHSLPVSLTPFIGRAAEIARMKDLFLAQGKRLVTLTGTGGCGKTRLAGEAGRELADSFGGAVCFVPLAHLTDPQWLPHTFCDALGIQGADEADPLEALARRLCDRKTLLILDNFEQILPGADLVHRLLERLPGLSCLVTSRRTLDLSSEVEYRVPPLPLPQDTPPPERLAEYDSVKLFVDRAQNVRPDFQVTPGNAPAVAELCRRLEGIPLALELAAARAMVYTPAKMIAMLDRRFDFLASRKRDVEDRHRTLRAALDWSYDLLEPDLRGFFAALSVFRGSFDPEAVEAVLEEPVALDSLERLREASLVTAAEAEGEVRFHLLESLREYAAERLDPDAEGEARARHARHYLRLAESAEAEWESERQSEWLRVLDAEHDNCRAALEWATEHPEGAEAGVRMASALCPYWHARGFVEEGRYHLRLALERDTESVSAACRVKALNGAGFLAVWQGDYDEADRLLNEAASLAEREGDRSGMALNACHRALSLVNRSRFAAAEELYERALEIFSDAGDVAGRALCLYRRGALCNFRAEYEQGFRLFCEALSLYRTMGNRAGEADVLNSLGNIAARRLEFAEAIRLFDSSLRIKREMGNRLGVSIALQNKAIAVHQSGNLAAARDLFEESLALRRQLGDRGGVVNVALSLAAVYKDLSDYRRAHQLFGEAVSLQRQLGHRGGLEGWAELLAEEKRWEPAALLFAAEEAHRTAIGGPLPPDEQAEHDAYLTKCEAALGKDAFRQTWDRGAALDWNQAADYALSTLL